MEELAQLGPVVAWTTRMNRALVLSCLSLCAVGCGPVDDDPLDPTTETSCVEGDAQPAGTEMRVAYWDEQGTFQDAVEGEPIERQFGFQGGSHIDLAARVFDLDGMVEFTIDDGQDFLETSSGAIPACDGWAEAQARIFDPPSGSATYTVRVTQGSQDLSDSITVVIP